MAVPDPVLLGTFTRHELARLALDFAASFDPARLPCGLELLGEPIHGGFGYSGAVVVRRPAGGPPVDAVFVSHFTNPLEIRTLTGDGDVAASTKYRLGRTDIEQSDIAFEIYKENAARLRHLGIRLDLTGYSLGGTESIDLVGRVRLDPSTPAAFQPRAYAIAAPDGGLTLRNRGSDLGLLDDLVINEVISNDSVCGIDGSYRLNSVGRNVFQEPVELAPGWTDHLGSIFGYDVDSLYDALSSHVPEIYAARFGLDLGGPARATEVATLTATSSRST